MKKEDREELYDLIDDVGTAMLVTDRAGELRSRPMKGQLDRDTGKIWFLTETPSGKTNEIDADRSANLTYACPEKETYISITGRAQVEKSASKIDDLWGPWAAAWLQCEKDHPKVATVCFTPDVAEYWCSPESSIVQTWELAKANLTGEKPELGVNRTLNMD
ncbi:MAG: pyridoxamine 5'-phosphate oxidase family protein [Erythrobacter sp.]